MGPTSARTSLRRRWGSARPAFSQRCAAIAAGVAVATVLGISLFVAGVARQGGGALSSLAWPKRESTGLRMSYACRSESWAKPEFPEAVLSLAHGDATQRGAELVLMDNSFDSKLPNVTAIVRTYSKDGAQIVVLLQSLLVSALGHVNLNILVINVDSNSREAVTRAVAVVNGLGARPAVRLALEWSFCERPVPSSNFMYGYDATDAALATVLRETTGQPDQGGWLLVTNGDNVYSRFFFSAVKELMHGPAQVISTRFTTNHHREVPGHGNQRNSVLPATYVNSQIDLGSFVTRMSRIRQFGSHFVVGASDRKQLFSADWKFLESLQLEGDEFANIPRVLFSHQ